MNIPEGPRYNLSIPIEPCTAEVLTIGVNEAVRLTSTSRKIILGAIRGETAPALPALRLGRRILVRRDDLTAWIDALPAYGATS